MTMRISHALAVSVFTLTALTGAQPEAAAPPIPEPSLPSEHADATAVYHTLTGGEAQVVFTSKAPLENIVGKSNQVVGYVVPGEDDKPAELIAAHWILPVETLATGIPLRDSHMTGSEWLDGDHFPGIEFELDHVEDANLIKEGEGFSTWSVTLVGEMKLRGESKEMMVKEAKLSFLTASDRTALIAQGDLMFLKCTYSVKLSDFGIMHKDVPDKVSDEIKLNQTLRLSTVKQTFDPQHE